MHFTRNLLALVPKSHQDMVAAVFRTIFAQPDADTVASTWDQVRDQLAARFPKIGVLMDAGRAEVLAFTVFPKAHWINACSIHAAVLVSDEDAGVPGMTPLDSALVASASQCLPGDPRLAAVA